MKILVINLMHLGDLMLVTPALTTLRKNFPNAHLALLADKKLAAGFFAVMTKIFCEARRLRHHVSDKILGSDL